VTVCPSGVTLIFQGQMFHLTLR